MSELLQRIRKTSLHARIMKAEDNIPFFSNGMNLGWSGFTPVGYPKVVPAALADHVIKTRCIACPPDAHPEEYWCAWEFVVEG